VQLAAFAELEVETADTEAAFAEKQSEKADVDDMITGNSKKQWMALASESYAQLSAFLSHQ